MILGKTGALISVTALNMHSSVFENVERFQYYQDTQGKVELRIVPMDGFNVEIDISLIEKAFFEKVGHEFELDIEIVDSIELTVRQKQLFLIQKIKLAV